MADSYEGMDPAFASQLQALIAASGGEIWINSGFRSVERQGQLFAAAVTKYGSPDAARKYVAPPGHSNHNFGLAADLGGDLKLAHQLAPQFGLRFPMGWEPWHIEPPNARGKRGSDYPQSQTDPPSGFEGVDTNPFSQLHTQLYALTEILKGRSGAEIDAELGAGSGTAAPGGDAGLPGAAAGGGATPSGGDISPEDLYKRLRAAGVDPVHAAALVSIAGRESSFKIGAYNGNEATGDNSHGLFQINTLGGQHSQYDLTSLEGQVAAAADMVQHGGLQPWGPYKGVSALANTDMNIGVSASGGEVTLADLQGIANEGL